MLLKLKKNKKGFTLIELIVVVAVLAILAAIAVPSFIGMQNKAQQGVDIANASTVAGAINVYNSMVTSGQITAATSGWATQEAMDTALGDLSPQLKDDAAVAAATARLVFNGNVAQVNTTIN